MASAALSSFVSPQPDLPAQPTAVAIERMLRTIRNHLEMDVAFASEVTPDAVTIRHADMGEASLFAVGDSFAPEEGYCQRIIDGRLPYLIPDTSRVPEAARLSCTTHMPIGSHLSVPLRLSNGRVYGTFCCFSFKPDHSLNSRDLQMMHAFAELAAGQIEAAMAQADQAERATARVRSALQQENLTMVYQPIYRLDQNRIVGVEALARFTDSELRPPSDWFEEAAQVGLGTELELAAVASALRGLGHLPSHLYLAVNVSPQTIASGRLEPMLRGLPPGRIVLEVTEHAMVSDYVALLDTLEPLRSVARLAVDDAGAGYSGLRHILDLKPDLIKLDMALTRGIDSDPARSSLASALVTFARAIGSNIVAEGIETKTELAALRQLGIDYGQGYFLRRPMPIAPAAQFLLARQLDAPSTSG